MSGFKIKWAIWGAPNGLATRIISSDFLGMGRVSTDVGIYALVLPN